MHRRFEPPTKKKTKRENRNRKHPPARLSSCLRKSAPRCLAQIRETALRKSAPHCQRELGLDSLAMFAEIASLTALQQSAPILGSAAYPYGLSKVTRLQPCIFGWLCMAPPWCFKISSLSVSAA